MKLKQTVLGKHKHSTKKGGSTSSTKIAVYVSAFLVFVSIIAVGYQRPERTTLNHQVASVAGAAPAAQAMVGETPSVDEMLATSVAADLTEQTRLPIASNIANASVSLSVKSALAQTDDTVTSKPQIIHSDSSARSIRYYTTERGDNVDAIARQFGVSAQTVKWANDLSSNDVAPGKRLKILPVDGVLYTFQRGDTVESIANRYNTSATRIVSYNDLELTKAKPGQQLIIPDGKLPTVERPGYTPPYQSDFSGSSSTNLTANFMSGSVGNRYAYGYCTWYAYERRAEMGRPVGSFWGNASSWASAAASQGYRVDHNPSVGAVFQTSGFNIYGHVAIVDKVHRNGSITISEMNYAGWNVVSSRTISAGQARSYNYIH